MAYAFDPELAAAVEMMPPFTLDDVNASRQMFAAVMAMVPKEIPGIDRLDITDRLVPGPQDAPKLAVRVYAPRHHAVPTPGPLPGILYMHAGGFVFGGIDDEHVHAAAMALETDAVVISVEYRLAPEHRYPAAVEDCYAALEWLVAQADELGIDRDRVAVAGTSAGGGLAAAVTLMARDRGGPRITFQMLNVPELDDRLETPSMIAYTDTPVWNRPNAIASWQNYLGDDRDDVPYYAAPARATDLSGLPPAYIATAQFDPLRDEGLEYASRLLQAGIPTEVHCFPGTFHGCTLTPFAAISQRCVADVHQALRRALHP
jgi:acetyl esterase/lipase